MADSLAARFCWLEAPTAGETAASPEERYHRLVGWAGQARGRNPLAFDALTVWLQADGNWTPAMLAKNRQALLSILERFKAQNAALRAELQRLLPHGVVNEAVFPALSAFDLGLSGQTETDALTKAARLMLEKPEALLDPGTRALIAGEENGPSGTDSVNLFGFVNVLKNLDAGVQWALFMPEVAAAQQRGFRVRRMEDRKLPPLRFIGCPTGETDNPDAARAAFRLLAALGAPLKDLPHDLRFSHHLGRGVDVQAPLNLWGRFYPAGTPAPAGCQAIDFADAYSPLPGPPYLSHFTFAEFEGEGGALAARAGFDVGAMYDVTRNLMLGRGISIPYPEKYWTAEVYPGGFEHQATAFLFSAHLP